VTAPNQHIHKHWPQTVLFVYPFPRGTCAERQQTALERAGNPGLETSPFSGGVLHPNPHTTVHLTCLQNPPAAPSVARPISTLKTIRGSCSF